jgi:hypothetical protein
MAYVGNTPTTQSFISGTDYFNGNGSTTAFTLSRTVASVNDIQAVVNNVVQVPNDAYTISGTTITFTSAPSSGTNNVYVRYLSTTTQAITPSQNTVSWNTLDTNTQQDLGISFKNRIINGNMAIDQRNAGASVSVSGGAYTLDRWYYDPSASLSWYTFQQNGGSVTPPAGFSNYLGITSTGANTPTSGQFSVVSQYIEGFNTADLNFGTANAKTITLSFWVRSSLTGTFAGALQNSAVNRSYPFSYTISSANTWEQKSITVVGDTTGTWIGATNGVGLRVVFNLGTGSNYQGTAGAWTGADRRSVTGATNISATNGATFYITGVQLEVGTQATTFTLAGGSYGAELQLCQRYYYRISCLTGGAQSTPFTYIGWSYSTSRIYVPVVFPQAMRGTPTLSKAGGFAYNPFIGGVVLTDMTFLDGSNIGGNIQGNSSAAFTNNTAYWIGPNTVASDFIAFSAEL